MIIKNLLSMLSSITTLVITAVLAIGIAPPSLAGTVLEQTYTSGISNGWVKVERWKDTDSAFIQEGFPADGRGDQDGQRVTFFGNDPTPHSSKYLLYYAPNWSTSSKSVPVLLVHGSNHNADIAWANPNEAGPYGCGKTLCPSTGLMQELVADDFKVFAISMPHKNGDNYFWAQQIADAISHIKAVTGASEVDIVAWSKGTFSARMYVSSVTEPWGTPYQNDVRRLILIGGPNGGFDSSFRHGTTSSVSVYSECGGVINGPTAHDYMTCYGWLYHRPEWTFSSSYFPGAAQMLKRWDNKYGFLATEVDWYSTYYGGWGAYSHSNGIDAYMGESLVDTVQQAGIPSSVRVHTLCGTSADIPLFHNEHTGLSDGVIFLDSCTDTTGVANNGGGTVFALNHLTLGWRHSATAQIMDWLNAI
ncbi:lipase [Halioxenophilus sp. WMMB6]|uniref:esterase/lipase family protein n=1 Tax=Halioxenophilus sp. WMMB6 TaxID=3073815 RepID=UPI00295E84D1|nr:lipase [Halioxenophilus sp. WMMB6]